MDDCPADRVAAQASDVLPDVLDELPDGVLVVDGSGRIVTVNSRLLELSGYSREEVEGRPIEALVPERLRHEHRTWRSDYLEDAEQRPMAAGRDLVLLRRDGVEVPVDIALSPIQSNGETRVVAAVRDLRAHREAERARRRAHRAYRKLFELNAAGGFRTTLDGELLEANRAFAELLRFDDPEELEGRSVRTLYVDPDDRAPMVEAVRREGTLQNHELRLERKDGTTAWVLVNAVVIEDPDLERDVLMGTVIDITERKENERRLTRLASRDPLTGLPNRRLLRDRAEQALSMARRNGSRVALVFVDLGDFKTVNDRHGHSVGDQVLTRVADLIEERLRAADTAARIGGDEFAALLTEVETVQEARDVAERLKRCCKRGISHTEADGTLDLHASFGVAVAPDHATRFAELLEAADEAMYEAKEAGGTRVVTADARRGGEPGRAWTDDAAPATEERRNRFGEVG